MADMHTESQRARLESLEAEYADLTERDLIQHVETGPVKWHFDDGGEAKSLDGAVQAGQALVNFAKGLKG